MIVGAQMWSRCTKKEMRGRHAGSPSWKKKERRMVEKYRWSCPDRSEKGGSWGGGPTSLTAWRFSLNEKKGLKQFKESLAEGKKSKRREFTPPPPALSRSFSGVSPTGGGEFWEKSLRTSFLLRGEKGKKKELSMSGGGVSAIKRGKKKRELMSEGSLDQK